MTHAANRPPEMSGRENDPLASSEPGNGPPEAPREWLDRTMRAYQPAAILLAAGQAGVFAALGEKQRTAAELAAELKLDPRALETVMLALAGLGVLHHDGERFRLSPAHAPYLLPGRPETLASILAHNHHLLTRWARLGEVLRTGRPVPREARPPDEMRAFICGMADISRAVSVEVAERIDLGDRRRMLDVGGGPATAAIAFCRRWPQLSAVVFDLEGPLGIARETIAEAGLQDRIEVRAGDYYEDELGEGFDLAYLSNIIHSMPPDEARMLLGKCRRALGRDGLIMVKDFLLEAARTEPAAAAVFSVNMLIGTEGGRSYTLAEVEDLLRATGFASVGVFKAGRDSRVAVARAV